MEILNVGFDCMDIGVVIVDKCWFWGLGVVLGNLKVWLFWRVLLKLEEMKCRLEFFNLKIVFCVEECLSLVIFFFVCVCFILFCRIENCFFNFKMVIFNNVILVKSFWVCIMLSLGLLSYFILIW